MHELLPGIAVSDVMWFVLTSVIAYGVKTLKDLSESMRILCLRIDGHEKTLGDHEMRIRDVE